MIYLLRTKKFLPSFLMFFMLTIHIISPDLSLGVLSKDDFDALYECFQILSKDWVQEKVNLANQIIIKSNNNENDWEIFFTEYFSKMPLTYDLQNYLKYPMFKWFGHDIHFKLQLGFIEPIKYRINSIINENYQNLNEILNDNSDIRQTLIYSHYFINHMLNNDVINESCN